ncbi:MAG: putative box helicase domain protein [Candidatus Kaiserbacteria bacterium]|nr:putative box helicase domain protein [Candidatus Kaiserbacteria bacterium]
MLDHPRQSSGPRGQSSGAPARRFSRTPRHKVPGSSPAPRHEGGGSHYSSGRSFQNSGRRSSGGGGSRSGGGRFNKRADMSRFINTGKENSAPAAPVVITNKFEDFLIEPQLKAAILAKGFNTPTAIQDQSIPHSLLGHDVVGIADTGSGKTGAFLIPLINKALLDHSQHVLIMVPTRELAQQIQEEFRSLTKKTDLESVVCVGGMPIYRQITQLRHGPAFVIGTPGRLKDLIERGVLKLSKCQNVVLDEADRMLDMGFINDMRVVLALLPPTRQTLFFSATMSREVEKLVGEFLNNPIRVSVKTGDTSKDITQDVVRVPPGKTKLEVLHDLLVQPAFNKVLIFGRTKHGVERLADMLVDKGFKAESIHGNKTQGKRQRALDLFRKDHVQILVATDVAARGLDITGVSHVINYELPGSDEDYIHRIGRTGRAGKKGIALTFVD